jgi:hypothetical protein
MNKELSNILKEAQELLGQLENGKTYPSEYVVKRFKKAAYDHSSDQLIGNMRDVLVKVAGKREYIHQNEIGKLYDKMYGLSGGQTAFRETLGDLLPENRQFAKIAHKGSNIRKMEEKSVQPIYKDSELSDAFSVLFSLGGDSSFGTYQPGRDKSVEKSVIAKLSGLGYAPEGVDVVETNEHFVLCAATHKTANLSKVTTLIPVQITDGVTREPKHIILGGEAVELDGRNLYAAVKEGERNLKNGQTKRFASSRHNGAAPIEIDKVVVPKSLERFADLEDALVAAASKFDSKHIQLAMSMLGSEFASFGSANPSIKIASSDERGILFDVHVPTRLGNSVVHVPVEINNGIPLLPSRFASDVGSNGQQVFDFNPNGFNNFMNSLSSKSETLNVARHTGELSKMSYHQLVDRMIDGVSNQDYKLAEDVLQTIEHRFGGDQFAVAFDKFSQLLKHSSDGSKRKDLIKSAFNRGDLIKIPTSVELYAPKLGLPVSKISFDEKGRVIPKGRRVKSENQMEGAAITTSRIILT